MSSCSGDQIVPGPGPVHAGRSLALLWELLFVALEKDTTTGPAPLPLARVGTAPSLPRPFRSTPNQGVISELQNPCLVPAASCKEGWGQVHILFILCNCLEGGGLQHKRGAQKPDGQKEGL